MHEFVEDIIILEGDLRDLKGRKSGTGACPEKGEEAKGEVWTKGCYAYRKTGMQHGPFRSEAGCLMFIVCFPVNEADDEMREGRGYEDLNHCTAVFELG